MSRTGQASTLNVKTKLNWQTTLASTVATKAYADACWQTAPTLSPDAWRLWEGFTISKCWLTIHGATSSNALTVAQEEGLNTWCVLPSGQDVVAAYFHQNPTHRHHTLLINLTPLEGAALPPPPPFLMDIWCPVLPETSTIEHTKLLEELEQRVQHGEIQCYGLAAEAMATSPLLPTIWGQAQQAAQQVWQRRKRPALRLAGLPLNLLELSALHTPQPNTAPVAFAAQKHIGVLALRPTLAQTSHGWLPLHVPHPVTQKLAQTLLPRLPEHLKTLTMPQLCLQLAAAVPGCVGVLTGPETSQSPQNIKDVSQLVHIAQPPDIARILGHNMPLVDNP